MNLIKQLYHKCKIRFGTPDAKYVEQLCIAYDKFTDPRESASQMSLYCWNNLTRQECKCFMRLYLKHHTADEGLLKAKWILENEHIRQAYLHGLCTRKIPLTAAEEEWILNCGEAGAMRCLKFPLSKKSELKLLLGNDFKMMKNYVICHVLSDAGEALLAKLATDKRRPRAADMYREVLKRYFELQHDALKQRIFASVEAQRELFADERNSKFIMAVIDQCNMDDFVLHSEIIRHLALDMRPRYLTWYLVYSFIPDSDLVAELMALDLPENLHNMITISEQRRVIHEICCNSWLLISDDWHEDECEARFRFSREDNEQKRMAELNAFLEPRLKAGAVSPTMSAWVAACCPTLAKEVMLNLSRYERNVLNKIVFINPLDLRDNAPGVYY